MTAIEAVGLLGMLSLLLISATPQFPPFSRSRALAVSGDKVTRLLAAARQHAIANKTLTAFIALVDHSSDANYRTFTIAARQHDGRWRQITNWEPLPDGITLDLDRSHCTFLYDSPSLPGFTSHQIAYEDQHLTPEDFACRIFLPHGGLSKADVPIQIRLVEGTVKGAGSDVVVQYERTDQDGEPASFYDITIAGATGRLKIHQR